MGILNVTPDSFSDGGNNFSPSQAVPAALKLIEEGADMIDVGGESTRPGGEPVPEDEELRRVIPVVEKLASGGIVVSVDTMKPKVAKTALEAGATIINDVTALRDPEMRDVCASARCTVCLMHMRGEPKTMQQNPTYSDVVGEVQVFLLAAAARAESAGIDRNSIWLDPGIGFGKTTEHNIKLLARLDQFVSAGFPILVGVSRKRFLAAFGVGEEASVDDRLAATLAVQVLAQVNGVKVIRAHDVRDARRAIEITEAIQSAAQMS